MTESGRISFSLRELARRFGGEIAGDPGFEVRGVASLESAAPDRLAFLANARFLPQLKATRAGAVIVGPAARGATQLPRIVCANPHAYFARVSALFNPPLPAQPGVHPSAVVDGSARVADDAEIGPCAVVERGADIGAGCAIGAGCYVGEEAVIGAGTRLYPNVTVYRGCVIGERGILHSGVVIGADGFGLALDEGRWVKVPQAGRVVIGNDVEIGANTTVDRGALDDTVIEEGVKLDNQIQVAHNVRIGAHTAIAACTGIAGSAKIGRHCRIGGASGIAGHITIADNVEISTYTLITKSIDRPGTYTGAYAFEPHRDWLRNAAQLRHLAELAQRVRKLEKKSKQPKRSRP
ncbi:MAG TPA: UDP-3-O-(3-hydroxymyristoyl)glucosamine N-acyltransferase [Burkholderiales bacterium]|nr:UDP-3-O-(3-hydroxymyristoyl)glucosamine N-acyltransferase [Burkholderiales bacterium]